MVHEEVQELFMLMFSQIAADLPPCFRDTPPHKHFQNVLPSARWWWGFWWSLNWVENTSRWRGWMLLTEDLAAPRIILPLL